jgi:hypothetical protein
MTEATEMKLENPTAVIVNAKLGSVKPNPFRDMVMFPIDTVTKVPALVESMQQTGVWPSIVARPKDNMINGKIVNQEELIAFIESGADMSEVVWEKAFGHHRQAAVEAMGYESMPIIPTVNTDEAMLQMMANENKEGFGSNINSSLETVRQVHKQLMASIADYDDYDAYVEGNGGVVANCFFTSSKAFLAAQKAVGFRTVKRFLGETWNERDVRAPFAVLKAVDDGLFHQEDIVHIPSMGLLEELSSIARVIFMGFTPQAKDSEPVPAPNWPHLFKVEAVEEVIKRCSANPAEGKANVTVTVAQLSKARQSLQKDGVNPASFLRSGKGKTAFDVYEAAKKRFLIEDADLEKNMSIIDGLVEVDGMGDWDGLEELQIKLRKAAERFAEGGGAEEPGDGELSPTTEADINADLGGSEGGDMVVGADFADVTEDGTKMPINQLAQAVVGDCEIVGFRADALITRLDELEADETFALAINGLLNKIAIIAMKATGKSALTDAFNAATKAE